MKAITLFLFSIFCLADSPILDSISEEDASEVSKEFAANFMHTTVSSAHSLGDAFGVEVGVVGGITTTPVLERLVREQSSSTEISKIPHAGAFLVLSIPAGFNFELSAIPEVSTSEGSLSTYSGAVRWTITDLMNLKLPIAFAVKGFASTSEFSYSQIVNNSSTGNTDVNATVAFDIFTYGALAMISADFVIIKPYFGLGFAKSETEIGVTGESATIFSFTTSQDYENDNSAGHFVVGAELTLPVLRIGIEASRTHSVNRVSGKFSLAF